MSVSLMSLWLPIVLSAVVVFFASFLAWVVLPHHKGEWKRVPNEDGFLEALRANNTPPGHYMFPHCESPQELKDPQVKARYDAGPHGTLVVWPGPPNMGANMVLSMVFYLVVGVFVAYLAAASLEAGARYLAVFQITGTAAIMAHCFGFIPGHIWFGGSLRSLITSLVDGVVYGLLTAGIFAWLWPG